MASSQLFDRSETKLIIAFVVIASQLARSAIQTLEFEFQKLNGEEGGRLVVQVWIDLHLQNLQQFIIIRQTTRQHTASPCFGMRKLIRLFILSRWEKGS